MGLAQRDPAVRVPTSEAAVALVEAGRTRATLTTLHRAAAAVDMTITATWLRIADSPRTGLVSPTWTISPTKLGLGNSRNWEHSTRESGVTAL